MVDDENPVVILIGLACNVDVIELFRRSVAEDEQHVADVEIDPRRGPHVERKREVPDRGHLEDRDGAGPSVKTTWHAGSCWDASLLEHDGVAGDLPAAVPSKSKSARPRRSEIRGCNVCASAVTSATTTSRAVDRLRYRSQATDDTHRDDIGLHNRDSGLRAAKVERVRVACRP